MSVYLYFHDAFQEISESGSQNFETLNYTIPNDPNNISIDDTFDPDLNFVSKKVNVYVSPEDFHDSFKKPETSYFSIRHLNTWNIKKNFVSLKRFLPSLDFTFSRIFFSETWCGDLDNFMHDLPNYASTPQKRSDRRDEGGSVYIYDSLNFKAKPEISTDCGQILYWKLYLRKHLTLYSKWSFWTLWRLFNKSFFKHKKL